MGHQWVLSHSNQQGTTGNCYGNIFDSSSSEDEDDPEVESVAAKNIDDDNQHTAQSGDTSNDADSLSYGNEDTRTTSNMGTHKHMEEIVLGESEEESGATILVETVLDCNTEYDWKIQHRGLMKKLEDRFNKEVHIPIAKQPRTVKDSNMLPCKLLLLHSHHSVDFPLNYEVEQLDLSRNPTITDDTNSACHPADEDLDVKLLGTTKTDDILLEDLFPTSLPLPHTATNRIGVGEQLNVSQDLNIFNDKNKMNSNENNE